MLQAKSPGRLRAGIFAALSLFVCAGAFTCAAQSTDIAYPAPVFSEEIAGRIAPRDIGDARRTRHFYTFRGTEGDVIVNVESAELNGDVDVFIATTLRPLMKVTLYGGTPTKVTKGFFLRKEETLILRVEARAVGDAEGTYRIRFGGSFAPAPANLAQAPEATPTPETSSGPRRRGNTRRVTSTGARIEEPRVEVPPAEEASAAPTPTPPEASTERAEETPAPRRGTSRRRGRGTTRSTPSRTNTPRGDTTPAETVTGTETTEGSTAPANPSTETPSEAATNPRSTSRTRTPPRRRSAPRRTARTETPAPVEVPTLPEAPSPRLIIVTKDGETLEREMSTVRRVTVENNQVVVVTRDGKTIRHPMANVLKMSIEP